MVLSAKEERFNALYDDHHTRLAKRIWMAVRDPDVAEEVEQLTWIKAWRYLQPGRTANYAWLATIAQSVMVDTWRRQAYQQKHQAFSLDTPLPGGDTLEERYLQGHAGKSAEEIMIEQENQQEDQRLCRAFLAPLTETQRAALIARFTGEPARVQAARTGKTVQAVCMARHHGLQNMQRRLKRPASYTFGRPRKKTMLYSPSGEEAAVPC